MFHRESPETPLEANFLALSQISRLRCLSHKSCLRIRRAYHIEMYFYQERDIVGCCLFFVRDLVPVTHTLLACIRSNGVGGGRRATRGALGAPLACWSMPPPVSRKTPQCIRTGYTHSRASGIKPNPPKPALTKKRQHPTISLS